MIEKRVRIAGWGMDVAVVAPDGIPPGWQEGLGAFPEDESGEGDALMRLDVELIETEKARHGNHSILFQCSGGEFCSIYEQEQCWERVFFRRGDGAWGGRFRLDVMFPADLSTVLRLATAFLCRQHGRVMLHASGVMRQGRVWVFFGPSGVGKTTVATQLNDGGVPFSVDQTVLEVEDDGRLWAYSTPFSDRTGAVSMKGPLAVDGLVYLEQASKARIVPLSVHRLTRFVLCESAATSRHPQAFAAVLRLAETVVARQMGVGLRFAKDVLFWRELDKWCHGRIPAAER